MPRKLCNRKGSINSILPLGKLLRFSEYLHDDQGQVEVCLCFDRDNAGHCIITGKISTEVNVLCQRCLVATKVTLISDVDVKVADSDSDAKQIVLSNADPIEKLKFVECQAGELDLRSLIEDELIMSLPIVVNHNNSDCSDELNSLQQQAQKQKSSKGSITRLEELAKLKQELKLSKDSSGDKNNNQNE